MKIYFQILCLLLLECVPYEATAQPTDTLVLSLEDAQTLALQNMATFQNQLIDGQIAKKQVDQAYAQLLPQISASFDTRYNIQRPTTILPGAIAGKPGEQVAVQFGQNWNNTAALELNQIIWDAKLLEDLKILKMDQQLTGIQSEATASEVKIAAIRAYLQVLVSQESLLQLNDNKQRQENTVAQTKTQVEAGLLNEIELQRVQTSLDNARSDLAKGEQGLVLNRQLLNYALGIPLDRVVELTDDYLLDPSELQADYNEQIAYPKAVEAMPTYRALQLQTLIDQKQIQAQQKAIWPTVSLYGYLGTNGLGNRFNWFDTGDVRWYGSSYIGLQLNWPLNNLLNNRQILPQLQLKWQQSTLQLKAEKENLSIAIAQAEANLKTALEEVLTQDRNMVFQQRELDYLEICFSNELVSSKDIVDAEKALRAAQKGFWIAYFNYMSARWELQKARGEI